jgi:hypothetical protein
VEADAREEPRAAGTFAGTRGEINNKDMFAAFGFRKYIVYSLDLPCTDSRNHVGFSPVEKA